MKAPYFQRATSNARVAFALLGIVAYCLFSNDASAQLTNIGYWRFNTTNWLSEAGQAPLSHTNLSILPDWSSNAVVMTYANSQVIYSVSNTTSNVFVPDNGTIRFWFQPTNWSSTNTSPAPPSDVSFLEAQDSSGGDWIFNVANSASTSWLELITQSNANFQPQTFTTGGSAGAPVYFQANLWYQIVLTYSPTNVALYTNGALVATANTAPEVVATGAPLFGVGNGNIYKPAATFLLAETQFPTTHSREYS